ncbi:hypothetical protein CPB83DRAFT_840889 [Crepidotus variabilis]|uniref:Uncharacterized protein n=1 Tax=Crepidotus variabilis TaxID=179855 RepID=A0A9P6E3K8_9AGAR|nr:hypothetical protein CPB83DRAFT_840889 [Crepidotus variabilis]
MPNDKTYNITMRDANGGKGSIFTTTSLHVGQTVPSNLLLGRPWQQEYYVSIVERKSGTSHEVAYFPICVYSAFTGRDSPTDWNQDEREAAKALVRLRNPIPLTRHDTRLVEQQVRIPLNEETPFLSKRDLNS